MALKKVKQEKKPIKKQNKPKSKALLPAKKTKTLPTTSIKKEQVIDKEIITHYLNVSGIGKQLQENEQDYFVTMATLYQLNPFKREIYCIPYEDWKGERSLSIVTGYEVYLKRAEELQDLKSWRAWTEGTLKKVKKTVKKKNRKGESYNKEIETWEGDLVAKIEIHRRSWQNPFYHEVYFNEYNKENTFWNEKPRTMIKKVAMAQGFRLCFPSDKEMGRMPYIREEMPDSNFPIYDTANNEKSDNKEPSSISPEEQAMVDKLNTLPKVCKDGQYILDGLRHLGYMTKAATAFCNEHEWDNDKMKKALDEIANKE